MTETKQTDGRSRGFHDAGKAALTCLFSLAILICGFFSVGCSSSLPSQDTAGSSLSDLNFLGESISRQEEDKLVELLKQRLPDDDHVEIISSFEMQMTRDYEIRELKWPIMKSFQFYMCKIYSFGLEGQTFIFAISKEKNDAYILTTSLKNYNAVVHKSGVENVVKDEAELLAFGAIGFTQVFHKYNVHLDNMEVATAYLKKRIVRKWKRKGEFKELTLQKTNLGEYEGTVLMLIGYNLVQRKIAVSVSGQVEFSDIILDKEVTTVWYD